MTGARAQIRAHVSVIGNRFKNLDFSQGGAVRIHDSDHFLMRGNVLEAEHETSAWALAHVRRATHALISDNTVTVGADFTGAHPSPPGGRGAFAIASCDATDTTITGNRIHRLGRLLAPGMVYGIGCYPPCGPQPGLRIERNAVKGEFTHGIILKVPTGTAKALAEAWSGQLEECSAERKLHLTEAAVTASAKVDR